MGGSPTVMEPISKLSVTAATQMLTIAVTETQISQLNTQVVPTDMIIQPSMQPSMPSHSPGGRAHMKNETFINTHVCKICTHMYIQVCQDGRVSMSKHPIPSVCV